LTSTLGDKQRFGRATQGHPGAALGTARVSARTTGVTTTVKQVTATCLCIQYESRARATPFRVHVHGRVAIDSVPCIYLGHLFLVAATRQQIGRATNKRPGVGISATVGLFGAVHLSLNRESVVKTVHHYIQVHCVRDKLDPSQVLDRLVEHCISVSRTRWPTS
jgi:hypothetical protein